MSLRVFLWRYFRRYSAWGVLALLSTFIFAFSMIGLLVTYKLILTEVIGTDRALNAEMSADEAAPTEPPEEVDPNPIRAVLRDFGLDMDLDAVIEEAWSRSRRAMGLAGDQVVWFLPSFFVVIFLLRGFFSFLTSYAFQIIGLGATNDLRNHLYGRILHQSSRFYTRHPSGELVSRLGNDVAVMQNAVSNRLLDLFLQPVTLLVVTVFLLFLHLRLAIIFLFVMPAVFYPIVRFGEGMRRTSRRSQERLAELSSLVAEAVRGHRVVKAFGMEAFEQGRFNRATARHLKVKLKSQLLANASGPVVESMAAIGGAAFLIYVGYEVRQGSLTPSQIMTFLTGLVMLYDPIRRLNRVNLVLQEARAAAQRIRDVMEVPNEIQDREGATAIVDPEPRITFEGVSFRYDSQPDSATVLDNIDLVIEPGEVVALVGPSGAGKSTLVNLLPRFFDPDAGRVLLYGHDLRDLTLESLRGQIGIVTQDTVLFNDTVRNNIAYGRADLPLDQVAAAAAAAYADEFIMEKPGGYDAVIGEDGVELSGGQRQRLAIARAILKDSPVLILDEATSHLDSQAEALVQKALYNLMEGRTALVIAHRLSTVKRADRILVMEEGQVVEEGSHEELLKKGGTYRRLYELQFQDM